MSKSPSFAVSISTLAHFVSHKTSLPYGWSVSLILGVLVGMIGKLTDECLPSLALVTHQAVFEWAG